MDTFIYLKSDMSRIMLNDMPYTKYRDENQFYSLLADEIIGG